MSLQSTDPIADLLTRIRNAVAVGKSEITVPSSKMKQMILSQLKRYNYIAGYKIENSKPQAKLLVKINNDGDVCNINEIVRISKPGRRMYAKSDEIPTVMNGRGLVLISTSKGIMSGKEAKTKSLGGELLLKVY
jgi:small subunit ribosomal protein S8